VSRTAQNRAGHAVSATTHERPIGRAAVLAVVVAALGYFVDIYDLVLFGVVRVASLRDLGLDAEAVTREGIHLINMQMWGMLVGGIVWGVIGDRKGRLAVLFGSIILYSLANIANGFVDSIPAYAWLRFIAGIGLAGELGAGITLVSEVLGRHARGYGTTIVASVGICGAVVAALVGAKFSWRTSYFVGGGLGFALLLLRIGVAESGLFEAARGTATSRGNVLQLFWPPARLGRYAATVLSAAPIWFVVGIPVVFAPEFGQALGIREPVSAGTAVMYCYIGLAAGDLASGVLSQVLRSRRKALLIFQGLTGAAITSCFLLVPLDPQPQTYAIAALAMGFGAGYWAVFVTSAAEQFGTNLRATAATSAPNFVRGMVPLFTMAWLALKEPMGVVGSASLIGGVVLAVAILSALLLRETYGRSLEFLEH